MLRAGGEDFLGYWQREYGIERAFFDQLSYTQWEAVIALFLKKRFMPVCPAAPAADGHLEHKPPFHPTAADTTSQNRHREWLSKTIRRRPQILVEFSGSYQEDAFYKIVGFLLREGVSMNPGWQRGATELQKQAQRLATPRFLHHTAEHFLGRESELSLLDTAWEDGTNVLCLVAWGGVGKTALLSEWIQTRFIDKQWRDADGQPSPMAYFDWSFYNQGTGSLVDDTVVRTGSVGDFFEQALTFFADPDPNLPGKGTRLAKLIRQQRSLFILDGLEPLQHPLGHPQAGCLLDPDLRDLLASLVQMNPGLCLLSSRQSIAHLHGLHGRSFHEKFLDDLPVSVAICLLQKLQITGTAAELTAACEAYGCHALSITLLGRYLFDAHEGDARCIEQMKDLHTADRLTREERHRSAWKVLENYNAWLSTAQTDGQSATLSVLRLTGLFDRTATSDCLAALRAAPIIPGLSEAVHAMSMDEWTILLKRIERAHLIKLRSDGRAHSIDAHPLVRQYFAHQLRTRHPGAYRAAHSRLFDHLCQTSAYRPDTLLGLQPLYQAVIHGCLAGRHAESLDEVYIDRIMRGIEDEGYFSYHYLGAFGDSLNSLSVFYVRQWSILIDGLNIDNKIEILQNTAFCLRALGRLTEALDPLQAGVAIAVSYGNSREATIGYGSLSEMNLTLGFVRDAVKNGLNAIKFADDNIEKFHRIAKRATTAEAYVQNGKFDLALSLFEEAKKLQKQAFRQDVLYSIPGFLFCDLTLIPAERLAWALCTARTRSSKKHFDVAPLNDACAKAERMVKAGQKMWTTIHSNSPSTLDTALSNLTLARVALYRAALDTSPCLAPDNQNLNAALDGLRQAGHSDELPRALLTSAHWHYLMGSRSIAQQLLTEAEIIAERGPMPLYLADVHLHRARLFGCLPAAKRTQQFPDIDPETDLKKARCLIEKHGYWRRKEELEDAEAAARLWD